MGMPFQDACEQRDMEQNGAERSDASISSTSLWRTHSTHGGLLARSRDVARFGLLYTPSYTKRSAIRRLSLTA